MAEYIFDGAESEAGYVLIKSDPVGSKTSTTKDSKTSGTSGTISDSDQKKLNDMISFGVSLKGKVPYASGTIYDSKEKLTNGATDCSGFVSSLYKIYFGIDLGSIRTDIASKCETINQNGYKGKLVYSPKNPTKWSDDSQIAKIIQPGDIVNTSGHVSMYIGDIDEDGVGEVLSQGGPNDGPTIEKANTYYSSHPIKDGIARFVGSGASVSDGTSMTTTGTGTMYPKKTELELQLAKQEYGTIDANGKSGGYSYDDLYFAYSHIEEYYKEINTINGHSLNGTSTEDTADLIWPVDTKSNPGTDVINTFYGYTPAYGKSHTGIDISAAGKVTKKMSNDGKVENANLSVGPDVIAAQNGTVIYASENPESDYSGYTSVKIESDDKTITTVYGHLSVINVSKGDKVKAGQVIGKMGTTGYPKYSTGVHLHFEVLENGKTVDPLNYFDIAKAGTKDVVDYSKIDKETIKNLPTGYIYIGNKGGINDIVKYIISWEG